MAGTLSPSPKFYAWNITTGEPLVGGKIYTVSSGGSYPANAISTFTTSALSVANANPIILNSAGYAVIYLTPGQSYKYIVTDANDVAQWTHDGIQATPGSASAVDITVTAGENLSAEDVVYVSDGSGGKNAGQAYKADADFTYASSSAGIVGMAVSAITIGAQGAIRTGGQLAVTQTLTPGAKYYVSATAGALTATAPANARFVGSADGVNDIIIAANPAVDLTVDNGLCDFRLTLSTGVPVTSADVTAATTLFLSPYKGNRITLYDASGNPTTLTSAQVSIAVPASTNQMYDIWAYNNSGVVTLELLAWTNDTTRATAIVFTTTGAYTKSGDLTRRYLGSFRTTGSAGQTEDSFAKRFCWNYYNRVVRPMRVVEATDSWVYSTATIRQANNSTANQLAMVVGVAEVMFEAEIVVQYASTDITETPLVMIGENSTTAMKSGCLTGTTAAKTANTGTILGAELKVYPPAGYTFYTWLERGSAAGTITWIGDNGAPTLFQSGIHGALSGA